MEEGIFSKFFTVEDRNRLKTDRKMPEGVCVGVFVIDFLYTLYNQASLFHKRRGIISELGSIVPTLKRSKDSCVSLNRSASQVIKLLRITLPVRYIQVYTALLKERRF